MRRHILTPWGPVYTDGLKDFIKAEEMYRLALDGNEKSLGKDHKNTKECAFNFAFLVVKQLKDKAKIKAHLKVSLIFSEK